jgi:hypothetical protein
MDLSLDNVNQVLTILALAGPPVITLILKTLGTFVVLAQSMAPLLPGKSSEEWAAIQAKPILGPILSALMRFSVVSKK